MPGQHPTNLPAPRSRLIGREQDLAALCELALHADGRLVTLTGAGGCGKTSLALAVARELVADFPDGLWLVELAPLGDPALVAQAVATPFGVQEGPSRSLVDGLVGYLEPRRLLLVLDNCEHLIDAAAAIADALLGHCPELRILATSREPLRIAGEATWRVPSLAFPDPRHLPPLGELAAASAVRLFVERARAAEPGFTLDTRSAPMIAQVCARLDGIPLALELAAARVHVLPIEEILGRLDDTVRLLTGGSRTAPSRQQTLRATLDWSHALLDVQERALFCRLAVFAGGWTLEAAEAVCPEDDVQRADVLDGLTRLVDKSLAVAELRDGERRYRLLEPVRQYAHERLTASGELQSVRRRHARFYLQFAERIMTEVWGSRLYAPFGSLEQVAAFARLEQELDNFRVALRRVEAAEDEDADLLLRLSGALFGYWFLYGDMAEGRRWLELALARSDGLPATQRARAAGGGGLIALHGQADYARAAVLEEQAVALFRATGNVRDAGFCLNVQGAAVGFLGDFVAARRYMEEAAVIFRELGDAWGVGMTLFDLGQVARYQGEAAEARALIEEGLPLVREAGDLPQTVEALVDLAGLAQDRGDVEQVEAFAREALVLLRATGMRWNLPEALELLAGAAGAQGKPALAARLFAVAASIRETTGAPLEPSRRLVYERQLAEVRATLPADEFAAVWGAARALSPQGAIDAALAAPNSPPPAGAAPAAGPLALLTPREREVAALLARGLSNRRIAEELVIADGTVNIHVHNVLGKLELSSRAQVAAWAVEHGLHRPGTD